LVIGTVGSAALTILGLKWLFPEFFEKAVELGEKAIELGEDVYEAGKETVQWINTNVVDPLANKTGLPKGIVWLLTLITGFSIISALMSLIKNFFVGLFKKKENRLNINKKEKK